MLLAIVFSTLRGLLFAAIGLLVYVVVLLQDVENEAILRRELRIWLEVEIDHAALTGTKPGTESI